MNITGPYIGPANIPDDPQRQEERRQMVLAMNVLNWISANTLWDHNAEAYYIPAQAVMMIHNPLLRYTIAGLLSKQKGLLPGPCPTCAGKGTVPQEATMTAQGMQAAGTGAPIPCPNCKGKKGA